jgi:hypothetical protein
MIRLELPGTTQVERQRMAMALLENPMYVEYVRQEEAELVGLMVDGNDMDIFAHKHQIRALRAFRDLVTKEATTKVQNAA